MDLVKKIIGIPGEVTKAGANVAMTFVGANSFLEIAESAFLRATQMAVLKFVGIITKTIIGAMVGYVGPIPSIWKAMLDNPANEELFKYLKRNWWEPATFLVDLLDPMKRFVSAESPDGTPVSGADAWNDYSELDLHQPMNRHAVFSQVQRFFKSVIEILKQKDEKDSKFVMDISLDSDGQETLWGTTGLKRKEDPNQQPETWLFVNGIAGEFYWNRLSVNKLRDFFFDPDTPSTNANGTAHAHGNGSTDTASRRTEIKGIFNRSDGILWDLIECGGERRPETAPVSKPRPFERTKSSTTAQHQLAKELRAALTASKTTRKHIVMVAHSQGCLLLRLALEQIYSDPQHADLRAPMASLLHVYTFGNPAYDWDVHAYTASTEHFANAADFVAVLGVLRLYKRNADGPAKTVDVTYCSRCRAGDPDHGRLPTQKVFVNETQTGHLFGSQYSLQQKDYVCANDGQSKSKLLARARRNVGPQPQPQPQPQARS